jgi:putative heme iron utilization protein
MALNRVNRIRQHLSRGFCDASELKAVRRQGHQVPSAMQKKRGSAVNYMQNDVPTLTHAEKAKTLLQRIHNGVLATNHAELDHPYASTVNLAMDEEGRAFTFISLMAEHTNNVLADNRASVLVSETQGTGDQLANARLTLVGKMSRVNGPEEKTYERLFLHNHPGAYYVEFDDFHCYRLEPEHIRYIGGFGEMSWVAAPEYRKCSWDAVSNGASFAIQHMNEDHGRHLLLMTKTFGGSPEATAATVLNLDRYGFDVLADMPNGQRRTRIGFKQALSSAEQIREAVVAMTAEARQMLDARE